MAESFRLTQPAAAARRPPGRAVAASITRVQVEPAVWRFVVRLAADDLTRVEVLNSHDVVVHNTRDRARRAPRNRRWGRHYNSAACPVPTP
ncbi:hypothetical protein GCM10009743_64510 [Kribbella swartbergensis]